MSSADIPADFERDPVTGDLLTVSRRRAAKRSFVDLVRTELGSRPWSPRVGTRNLLFENSNVVDRAALVQTLEELAFNYAPEILLRDIRIEARGNRNQLKVFIEYTLRGESDERNLIEVDI